MNNQNKSRGSLDPNQQPPSVSRPVVARPLHSPLFSSPTRRRFSAADPLAVDIKAATLAAGKQRQQEVKAAILELRLALARQEEELLRVDAEVAAAESQL